MRRASIPAPIRAAATPPAANPIHAARRCSMLFPLAYCRAVSIGEESDNSLTGGTGENQLREELGCVHLLGLGVAFDEGGLFEEGGHAGPGGGVNGAVLRRVAAEFDGGGEYLLLHGRAVRRLGDDLQHL